MAARILEEFRRAPAFADEGDPAEHDLTPRELEVLELVAARLSNTRRSPRAL